jgi:hypothetical protein
VLLPAGSGLPETSISVVNGAGNRVVKSLIGGQRQQLKVVSAAHCSARPLAANCTGYNSAAMSCSCL